MAVTGTITITTVLFWYIAARYWRWPRWVIAVGATGLITVDLLFFAANLTKLIHGAWVPLLIGLLVFTVLITWQRGRELVTLRRQQDEGPLQEFIDSLHGRRPAVHRVPGIAVFLNRGKETAPLAMRANVEHNHVLHRHVLILSIETVPAPHVPEDQQVTVDALGDKDDRITFVAVKFGYMDRQNIPALLPLIRQASLEHPLGRGELSYFLSTIDITISKAPGLSRWRKRLFLATSRITADAAEFFQLPRDSTVIMGSRIEL
jgi:KUP system potassium uptake protein